MTTRQSNPQARHEQPNRAPKLYQAMMKNNISQACNSSTVHYQVPEPKFCRYAKIIQTLPQTNLIFYETFPAWSLVPNPICNLTCRFKLQHIHHGWSNCAGPPGHIWPPDSDSICVHRGAANLAQNPEAKHRPELHKIPVKGTVAALGVSTVFGLVLATEIWATFWPQNWSWLTRYFIDWIQCVYVLTTATCLLNKPTPSLQTETQLPSIIMDYQTVHKHSN